MGKSTDLKFRTTLGDQEDCDLLTRLEGTNSIGNFCKKRIAQQKPIEKLGGVVINRKKDGIHIPCKFMMSS